METPLLFCFPSASNSMILAFILTEAAPTAFPAHKLDDYVRIAFRIMRNRSDRRFAPVAIAGIRPEIKAIAT